jgi:hypothetical protein
LAARLRAVLLPLDDDLLVPEEDLRALDVERRLDELDDDELVLRLRALDPPRAVDFRAPEELDEPPDLRALDPRALDPDDLRADPPPDAFFRDDPPPLPELDSAIALPPLKLRAA